MLYFDADELAQILAGKKTVKRHVEAQGDYAESVSHGEIDGFDERVAIFREAHEWIRRGNTYGVSAGADAPVAAQIFIRGIDREELHDITPDEALREGITEAADLSSIEQFSVWWDALHPAEQERWTANP